MWAKGGRVASRNRFEKFESNFPSERETLKSRCIDGHDAALDGLSTGRRAVLRLVANDERNDCTKKIRLLQSCDNRLLHRDLTLLTNDPHLPHRLDQMLSESLGRRFCARDFRFDTELDNFPASEIYVPSRQSGV